MRRSVELPLHTQKRHHGGDPAQGRERHEQHGGRLGRRGEERPVRRGPRPRPDHEPEQGGDSDVAVVVSSLTRVRAKKAGISGLIRPCGVVGLGVILRRRNLRYIRSGNGRVFSGDRFGLPACRLGKRF